MARWRYSAFAQRPESDDSDVEEHILVRGRPPTNANFDVGDIRFWLEDRMRREREQVNALERKSNNNDNNNNNIENLPPAKATNTHLKPQRRKTTTPIRLRSHPQVVIPARKLPRPPEPTLSQQSPLPDQQPPLLPVSPHMPPRKPKADTALSVRARRQTVGASVRTTTEPTPELPAPQSTRRSTRCVPTVNYDQSVHYRDDEEPETELKDDSDEEAPFSPDSPALASSEDDDSLLVDFDAESSAMYSDESEEPPSKRTKTRTGRAKPAAEPDTEPTSDDELAEGGKCFKGKSPLQKWREKRDNMKNLASHKEKSISQVLPPLSSISEIFGDLTAKAIASAPGVDNTLEHVLDRLGSRPLRVATMCSGTESPVLAMEMFSDALKSCGMPELQYDHVFSAEIVPFKQAYIERNFHPAIIFRDILEMTKSTDGKATTAYGALKEIPCDIDILIAGTACVDYSRLNNSSTKAKENGESKDTWNAVLGYAKKFRPRILVLENVYGAPWNGMLKDYEDIEYLSAGVMVDTKNYYLPQTRQRGYMVCFDQKQSSDTEKIDKEDFYALMKYFKRQASAPISSFLLPSDDPANIRARHRAVRQSALDDKSLKEPDWENCEVRHIRHRKEFGLGDERPLTGWQDNGILNLSENADKAWYKAQVQRVWDFLDMSLLRKALRPSLNPTAYYDSRYKTRIWDVSQNIDRFVDSAPAGIAPCLTPSGNFYLTDREGPLTFMERLLLQGLPLNKMSFTTETERNIQDFAGNAMSTPVVGSAILSALITGLNVLPEGPARILEDDSIPFQSIVAPSGNLEVFDEEEMIVDNNLVLKELQEDASASASKCVCEGQTELAKKSLQICTECGHTSCIACGTKPIHEYRPSESFQRKHPQEFIKEWRSRLPMILQFERSGSIETVQRHMKGSVKKQKDSVVRYLKIVENATKYPLASKGFRRGRSWVATYESISARLELVLDAKQFEWKLYAKVADDLFTDQGLHELRDFLCEPIAKCEVNVNGDSLFGSNWRWRVFESPSTKIDIIGKDKQIPSWAARIGLVDHLEEKVWSVLSISTNKAGFEHIIGDYKLLQECGTACESLYKRLDSRNSSQMILFLDPSRIGPAELDCFVFASDPSRLDYDQTRDVSARIHAGWRPENMDTTNSSSTKVTLNGTWIQENSFSLTSLDVDRATHINRDSLLNSKCGTTNTVAVVKLDLPFSNVHERFKGPQQIQADDKPFFDTFGWALESLRQDLELTDQHGNLHGLVCTRCAPLLPDIRWRFMSQQKSQKLELRPYEDPETATEYEVAIKNRPEPLVMESNIDGSSFSFTVGINILTLCERAAGKLARLTQSANTVSWSLNTRWSDDTSVALPAFTFLNNNENEMYETKVFKGTDLFEKQKRSLSWMLKQESGKGQSFVIQTLEEALLPFLGWRLEAEASSKVYVRGGILADHAGFGKTITSLALVHSEWQQKGLRQNIINDMTDLLVETPKQTMPRKIAATLIVCPKNLVQQWTEEIERRLKYNTADVISIKDIADLKKHTVEQFERAKIIIVENKVLSNQAYLHRLAKFSAMPECKGDARATQAWIRKAASRVPAHLALYEKKGTSGLESHLKALLKETVDDPEYLNYYGQSKRLKGQAYRDNKRRTESEKQQAEREADEPEQARKNFTVNELKKFVLFEMFHFNRLIVDEFSYLDAKELVAYRNIRADKRWALSATPQLHDTYDVSKMAQLLGIDLPVSASAPGLLSADNTTALRKDMTNVEQFETFRELPSTIVQEKVHALSQNFLNTYARQNVLKFDEFSYKDLLIPVELNADHRLAYADVSRKLNGQNMRVNNDTLKNCTCFTKIPKKDQAEEILVRAGAIYKVDSDVGLSGSQMLLNQRLEERETARTGLETKLKEFYDLGIKLDPDLFPSWIQHIVKINPFKDQTVTDDICKIPWVDKLMRTRPIATKVPLKPVESTSAESLSNKQSDVLVPDSEKQAGKKKTNKRSRSSPKSEADEKPEVESKTKPYETEAEKKKRLQEKKDMEEQQGEAIRKAKIYASAKRNHRYVENAVQRENTDSPPSCQGTDCPDLNANVDDLHVSGACGHILCAGCFENSRSTSGTCPTSGCRHEVRTYDLLRLGMLGESRVSKYGQRADELVELLHTIQDKDEQAILFVQHQEVIDVLVDVLIDGDISHHDPHEKDKKGNPTAVPDFQRALESGQPKKTVLILKSSDVSAAGSNLTQANHVIFFSPLLETSQYKYESQMAQAIGRVRRPGQKREIYVYRMLALNTIDVDILEFRERNVRVLQELEDSSLSRMTVDGTDFEGTLKAPLEKSDRVQLVRDDQDGKVKLVPRKMLLELGKKNHDKEVYETDRRVMGYEKFNSLLKFSRYYDDEHEWA